MKHDAATEARSLLQRVAIALVWLFISGCASLPDRVERPLSHADHDVRGTALDQVVAASFGPIESSTPPRDAPSGLRLLPDGSDAFEARLALAAAAQKSIDAQYYLVADDDSGRQFLRGLRDAAGRGVRVRLLIDDLNAGRSKPLLAELAGQPNVELRMFNPLPVRTGSLHARVLLSMHAFERINRRMHNKLFIADASFAITGGRNIGDEYFDRSRPANFIDMDVLVAGPAVRELAAVFDHFWNSELSYPLLSLVDAPLPRQARLDAGGDGHPGSAARTPAPVRTPCAALCRQLADGKVELEAARVRVLADAIRPQPAEGPGTRAPDGAVMRANLDLLDAASHDVLVVSPYLVPTPEVMQALVAARADGVRVSMVTNSLATTDEPLAHFGYVRYRETLARMGVALHELMPTSPAGAGVGGEERRGSLARLHAKIVVVDQREIYVGSMNMDRRSARFNTEMGLLIDSPALAGQVIELVRREQLSTAYAVLPRRGARGVEWAAPGSSSDVRPQRDPTSGWAQRLGWSVLSSLVDEDHL